MPVYLKHERITYSIVLIDRGRGRVRGRGRGRGRGIPCFIYYIKNNAFQEY